MDYDSTNLPDGYDRARDHGPEVSALWMDAVESYVQNQHVKTILDLGCGTGRFTESLANRFDALAIGVDPSRKMLGHARAKQNDRRVQYFQAAAEALPLNAAAIDLIFMSMSFHHFNDAKLAARECRRVLRRDGTVIVRTGTSDRISSYPYIPFFPTSPAVLEAMLPSTTKIRAVFESAGFAQSSSELITQTLAPSWSVYADKLSAGGDSALAQLTVDEFHAGLSAMRRHHETGALQAIVEPIDLLVFR